MSTAVSRARAVSGVGTVLHIVNGEHYAGAERVQDLLAMRLPDFGYQVAFATLKRGTFQRRLEEGDYEARSFTMQSRFDLLGIASRIADYARTLGAGLIHTHTPRSALIGALASRRSGIPFVHHVHSPTDRDTTGWLRNRRNALVESFSLARAEALIPVSESLRDNLLSGGYAADRIVTIPNGVAVRPPSPRPVHGDSLAIGMVALFRPRKGLEVLLDAMASLVARGRDVRLVAVGPFETESYRRIVEQRTHDLGLGDRVNWRGFQRDVFAEFARMDLLALPSLFGEGMPMVVLEAMSAGVPVVATRVEGVPEVIREGREGLLVSPGDADGLAAAFETCLDDGEALRAMGTSGRHRQLETYSEEAMASSLGALYDRVLERHRDPGHGPGRPPRGEL